MPSFVGTLVTAVSSTTVSFLTTMISTYWGSILGVSAVLLLIGMFYRLGHFGFRRG